MEETLTVRGTNSTYEFKFLIHRSESVAEQMIEEDFYKDLSAKKAPPEGTHYEIEVLTDLLVMCPNGQHKNVHIHPSKKHGGRNFICWTQQVESLDKVNALIRLWSLGTVYTLENGESFAKLIHTYDGMPVEEINNRRGVIEGQGVTLLETAKA